MDHAAVREPAHGQPACPRHVPGTDPRHTNGDGTDGFDAFQTRACSGTPPSCGADTTPNAGGLDQNIWGLILGQTRYVEGARAPSP